jgi:hypothetical protein
MLLSSSSRTLKRWLGICWLFVLWARWEIDVAIDKGFLFGSLRTLVRIQRLLIEWLTAFPLSGIDDNPLSLILEDFVCKPLDTLGFRFPCYCWEQLRLWLLKIRFQWEYAACGDQECRSSFAQVKSKNAVARLISEANYPVSSFSISFEDLQADSHRLISV